MARIFISYRRDDTTAFPGRIYDRLVAHFGRENVFKDVDDIPAGARFDVVIEGALRRCNAVLVVISQHWLDARTPDGRRRLDNPGDWVRLEIERALALRLAVIPLLVEGTPMPKAEELPPPLRDLVRLQALRVRNDPDFGHDMERVIAALERTAIIAAPRPAQSTTLPQPVMPAQPVPAPVMPAQPVPAQPLPAQPLPAQAMSRQPSSSRPFRRTLIWAVPAVAILVLASLGLALLHLPPFPSSPQRPTTGKSATPTATATATITPTPVPLGWSISPGPSVSPPGELNGISVVPGTSGAATEAWAVGDGGVILHYQHGAWISVPDTATTDDLKGVWMVSATEGWAVGGTATGGLGGSDNCNTTQENGQFGLGIVLHYLGGHWKSAPLPRQENLLWSISMASPSAGWIVGSCGTMLYYNGSQWIDWGDPNVFKFENLWTVAAVSATEAWAGGGNDTEPGVFVHFLGGANGTTVRVYAKTNGNHFIVHSIAMVNATNGWAVGGIGTMLHYDGSGWTAVTSSPTALVLYGIAMLPSGAAGWAVGAQGTILQFTGGNWQQIASSPTSNDLKSVVIVSPTEAWAVAANGAILRYNGG